MIVSTCHFPDWSMVCLGVHRWHQYYSYSSPHHSPHLQSLTYPPPHPMSRFFKSTLSHTHNPTSYSLRSSYPSPNPLYHVLFFQVNPHPQSRVLIFQVNPLSHPQSHVLLFQVNPLPYTQSHVLLFQINSLQHPQSHVLFLQVNSPTLIPSPIPSSYLSYPYPKSYSFKLILLPLSQVLFLQVNSPKHLCLTSYAL